MTMENPVSNLSAIELKAHLPAKDFEISKQFYQDLGFTLCWSEGDQRLEDARLHPPRPVRGALVYRAALGIGRAFQIEIGVSVTAPLRAVRSALGAARLGSGGGRRRRSAVLIRRRSPRLGSLRALIFARLFDPLLRWVDHRDANSQRQDHGTGQDLRSGRVSFCPADAAHDRGQ